MDLSLSDEQQLIKDSAERFVRERYPFDQRQRIVDTREGFSEAHWREMAELGWLGIATPERFGGFGGGATEVMVVMEALGAGLVPTPFFASAVLTASLVELAGDDAQCEALLAPAAAGDLKLSFAWVEPQSGYDLFDVETRAETDGDGYRLHGAKSVVPYGMAADRIVVSARVRGEPRDRDGLGLFVIDPDAQGATRRGYATQDGLRAAEVVLDGVRVERSSALGSPGGAIGAIETAAERAIAALCAEAVGCLQVTVDATNEHLKTREQFGRPIGSFQVLQHQMVDMFIALEESRSMCHLATAHLGGTDARARARAVSAAKMLIGRHAQTVGEQSIQLHGGMGMTHEMAIGHYFKRLAMIDVMLGDSRYHLDRYAAS